jgi:hypothetical protein
VDYISPVGSEDSGRDEDGTEPMTVQGRPTAKRHEPEDAALGQVEGWPRPKGPTKGPREGFGSSAAKRRSTRRGYGPSRPSLTKGLIRNRFRRVAKKEPSESFSSEKKSEEKLLVEVA